jgi:hypothetical protein
VIGVLIIGAVAVAILNIMTFGPAQKPSHRVQAAAMDQPALPPDLAQLVTQAMKGSGHEVQGEATLQDRSLPRLNRDPFEESGRARARVITAAPVTKTQPADKQLICSAVMTGGKRPSAMINGKFYSPGDKIGSYTLAWIASNGVTIQTGQGSKKFLPLTNKSGQSGKLQVTVGQRPTTG